MIFVFCSKLGLDLVPRLDGEIVDADSLSVVDLYKVVSRKNLRNCSYIDGRRNLFATLRKIDFMILLYSIQVPEQSQFLHHNKVFIFQHLDSMESSDSVSVCNIYVTFLSPNG